MKLYIFNPGSKVNNGNIVGKKKKGVQNKQTNKKPIFRKSESFYSGFGIAEACKHPRVGLKGTTSHYMGKEIKSSRLNKEMSNFRVKD